jgi:cytochrome c-type biogenesis protein CcmF
MALTAVVFLGTFYPVLMEAISTDKISVGPPYYNLVFAPLAVPLLLLVTVGPMLQWKRDSLGALGRRLVPPLLAAIAVGVGLWLAMGWQTAVAAFGYGLAAWLVAGAIAMLARRSASWRMLRSTPPAVLGMALAHAGLGITTAGITAMSVFATSNVLVMTPGQTTRLGDLAITMTGAEQVRGPNYEAVRADFSVARGGDGFTLHSERRLYPISGNQTTEAGIRAGLWGNAYVAIGDPQGNGLVVRVYRHPLAPWIWVGALIMALGGAISLADRRFRIGAPSRAPLVPRAALAPAE